MSKERIAIKNNHGFSLIEVLLAIALTGGLALLGAKLFKQQTTGQKTVEANYEVASILQQIKTVLSVPSNCAGSLQGLKPASGIPTVLKKEVGSVFENVYGLNTFLPGNIKITSYSLSKSAPGLASDETMLRINFSRGSNTLKDQTMKNIKIVYTLNGSGNILTCYAFNNNSDTFWVQSLVKPDDIFYLAGNVGVGTATPNATLNVAGTQLIAPTAAFARTTYGQLQVVGDIGVIPSALGTAWIRPASPSDSYGLGFHGTRLRIGAVQGNASSGSALISAQSNGDGALLARFGYILGDGLGAFEVRNGISQSPYINLVNNTGESTFFANSSNGYVGIGTTTPTARLEVNGPIKVGVAPDLCNASIAGQQRYKSDTKIMQYCNGTSWISMNGGGLDYTPLIDGASWSSLTLSGSGGSGTSSGSPYMNLSSLGGYTCGPLTTVFLSTTGITSTTKAALVSFASFDSSESSPAARIFTTGNQFVGLVGQSGRGGDGRSFGAGGEITIPLANQQFRIQFCKNEASATFHYAVKAILN